MKIFYRHAHRADSRVPVEGPGFRKELIVVNDGASDNTMEIAREWGAVSRSFSVSPRRRTGKGKAVQRGIREATADYILILDADLQCEPRGYLKLCFPGKHLQPAVGPWFAGVLLTLWTELLYQRWIITKACNCARAAFETDHEITANLVHRGQRIAPLHRVGFATTRVCPML